MALQFRDVLPMAQRKVDYTKIDNDGSTRYKLIRYENTDGTVAKFIDPFP